MTLKASGCARSRNEHPRPVPGALYGKSCGAGSSHARRSSHDRRQRWI